MRLPTSTYRLQFNSSFGFKEAKEIVPYLAGLGISDIYASPIFKARKGSTHGYDVTDPRETNPELGTAEEFEELALEAKNHGLGWIQDTVPNHMAYSDQNPILSDLLENGSRSGYRHFFDINWSHPGDDQDRRLLAPFLADHYSRCLERGEIGLTFGSDGFRVNYSQFEFPLRLESYAALLKDNSETNPGTVEAVPGHAAEHIPDHAQDLVQDRTQELVPDFAQDRISDKIQDLVPDLMQLSERDAEIQSSEIKRSLWKFYSESPEVKRLIDGNLEAFKGRKDDPESFDLLDDLLSQQNFKLAFWKAAREEINYRRFFTINDLISVRVEDEVAFNTSNALALGMIESGRITGLRIDHIDGLFDPEEYLKRLRSRAKDCYIVVEKILSREEGLPASWPVQGTTGYDFLNMVSGLFCNQNYAADFDEIYSEFTGETAHFDEIVYQKKKMIIERQMNGDIDNLTRLLKRIAAGNRYGRDATFHGLRRSLVEVLSLFPVYRTYVSIRGIIDSDRRYIRDSLEAARKRNPDLKPELDFLEKVLLLDLPVALTQEDRARWVEFAMRFQQFSGPLMAKGFEDTVLYTYNRLISQNNVGGSPEWFGVSVDEFHMFCQERAGLWPHSMNATSTHDTKRGEDSFARINALSEMPCIWSAKVSEWSGQNKGKKRQVRGVEVPDRNEEYFLYQTLVGALPFYGINELFCDRIKEYMVKSLREGKVHSHWTEQDADYEQALISFLDDLLQPGKANEFQQDMAEFCTGVSHYGIFNSLSQSLIKIAAPGVPDFYQGTELWDLSFVDPDNRRPVDFKKRISALEYISRRESEDLPGLARDLLAARKDGRIKLFLTHRALLARRSWPELFGFGSYLPLKIEGEKMYHCIAFARVHEGRWAVTIAPRFLADLMGRDELPLGREVWGDTRVDVPDGAPNRWKDAIIERKREGDQELYLGELLDEFPVALLQGRVEV